VNWSRPRSPLSERAVHSVWQESTCHPYLHSIMTCTFFMSATSAP
jgi:hypothetical protein